MEQLGHDCVCGAFFAFDFDRRLRSRRNCAAKLISFLLRTNDADTLQLAASLPPHSALLTSVSHLLFSLCTLLIDVMLRCRLSLALLAALTLSLLGLICAGTFRYLLRSSPSISLGLLSAYAADLALVPLLHHSL